MAHFAVNLAVPAPQTAEIFERDKPTGHARTTLRAAAHLFCNQRSAQLPSMDEWLVLIKLDRYAAEIKEEGYDELEFLGPHSPAENHLSFS